MRSARITGPLVTLAACLVAVAVVAHMPNVHSAEQKPVSVCQYAAGKVVKMQGGWKVAFPVLPAGTPTQRAAVCLTNDSKLTAMAVVEFPAGADRTALNEALRSRTLQLSVVRCAGASCDDPQSTAASYDPSTGRAVLGKLVPGGQLVLAIERLTTADAKSLPATSLRFGVHFE